MVSIALLLSLAYNDDDDDDVSGDRTVTVN